MRSVAVPMVALLAFSACIDHGLGNPRDHAFGGSFTPESTPADIEDFVERMRGHDGEVAIMESFPPQFRVGVAGSNECDAAFDEASRLDYVATARPCERIP